MQVGSYRITSLIGEGSFGRTFKGTHVILGTPVCVKQEKTAKQPYMDLFQEEARVLARLEHPGLPSFRDYLELPAPAGQILILSYAEGEPLDKVIETVGLPDGTLTAQKPIADEHICWIVDRLLAALSYLHGKWRIIHCDLKPANVILDIPNHELKIVDLGMAAIRPDEWSKAKGGTPGYLPSEFATGLPPIPASDIYSIGKIVCAIAGGDYLKGEFPADMDARLRAFFEPWILHDPTKRPQSTDALRNELAKLRRTVFNRSTTREAFRFRNDHHQPK